MAIAPVLRVVAKRLIPLLLELGFEELKALTMKENESGASVVLEGSYQGSEVNMLVSLTVGEDGMVTFGFGPYKTTGSISRWIQMLGDQFASMPSGKPGSVVKTLSNISLLTKLQKVISRFPKSLQKSAATPMEYARIARNVSDKYLDIYSVSKSAKGFSDRRNTGRLASAKWVRDEELAVRSSRNGLLPAAADVKGSWAVAYYLGTWYIVVIPPGLDTNGMKTGVEFRQVKNKTQGVSLVNAILTAYPQLISADEGDLKRNAAGLAEVIKTALEPRVRPPSNPNEVSRRWEPADIEIVTTKGNLTYSGIKYGTWAVLKTPDGWGVTNTPSGMRVTPLKNKAEGIKLVDTILKEYPQLWDAGKDEILQNTSVIIPLIKAMKESRGKTAKDLPKTVERYVKEHKEQGNDEAKSWALAWSRYCKHKEPNSPHCKQEDYFTGRKAAISPASQLYKVLLKAAKSVGVDNNSQKFRAAVREADNFEEAVRSGLSDWVTENVKSFDERKYRGDVRKIVDVLMKSPDSEAPFVYFSELDSKGRANIFRKWRGFFSDPKKIETLSIFMQNHLRNPLKDLKEALEDVATEGAEAAEDAAAEAEAEEGGDEEEDNRGTSVEVSEDDDFFWNLLF